MVQRSTQVACPVTLQRTDRDLMQDSFLCFLSKAWRLECLQSSINIRESVDYVGMVQTLNICNTKSLFRILGWGDINYYG